MTSQQFTKLLSKARHMASELFLRAVVWSACACLECLFLFVVVLCKKKNQTCAWLVMCDVGSSCPQPPPPPPIAAAIATSAKNAAVESVQGRMLGIRFAASQQDHLETATRESKQLTQLQRQATGRSSSEPKHS